MLSPEDAPEATPNQPAFFPIPERLVQRIPPHLVPVWHANGGYLNERDFSANRRNIKPGEAVQLTPAERDTYYGYHGRETYDIQQRRIKAEAAKFDAFLDTEAGTRFKAQAVLKAQQQESIDAAEYRARLGRIKPFLSFARKRLPGQSKFIEWLESRDGSYLAEGVIFGRNRNDDGADGEGIRIFQDPISRAGRGIQIRMAMERAYGIAAKNGILERFKANDNEAIAMVIDGVLEAPPAPKKAPPTLTSSGEPEIMHVTGDTPVDAGLKASIMAMMEENMGAKDGPTPQQRLALMLLQDMWRNETGIRFRYDVVPEADARAAFANLRDIWQ